MSRNDENLKSAKISCFTVGLLVISKVLVGMYSTEIGNSRKTRHQVHVSDIMRTFNSRFRPMEYFYFEITVFVNM